MILTEENIKEWKEALNKKMKDVHGVDNYSDCNTDEEWLDLYLDATEDDAIGDELQYWD